MGLASELEACLREFTAAATVEIRENGKRAVPFSGLSWEVRGAAEKPLLHLWSESYNVTRRVLAITDHCEQRFALAVECFGRAKPDRLEFVRVEFQRPARELSREEFCARLRRILAEQFPDEAVESLTVAADLEHSLSGNYARGILRRGSLYWAVLAVPDGESPETVDNSLTFALLWLDRVRQSSRRGSLAGLRVILPKGRGRGVAHRSRALQPQLVVEMYERDAVAETLQKLDGAAGNVDSRLVPHRETQLLLDRALPALKPVINLCPRAITVHPSVPAATVWLRFRGLAIARWHDGQIFFGVGDPREPLTPASRPRLQKLLKELENHRHPLASDTRHTLYRRAQPERWLEAIVGQDVTLIEASLDPRFVYAQVFANTGGEHGILDLLAVTLSGRLAILELKTSEHIHLPLQAADYWLRVLRHLEEGDFVRLGYFSGVALQQAPPLVYLVAPALRFHPATDALLRHLTPELEVIRVGLAESWRRGICVVMRQ